MSKNVSKSTASAVRENNVLTKMLDSNWLLFLVLVLTTIVFIPTLSNGFVNWDDDVNLLNNPNLLVLDWSSFQSIFSSTILGNYNPLPIFSFTVERHFFGLDPFVFHLDNLILHLFATILVFFVGKKLIIFPGGAALCAALFAIHPMHVESVAWITERKDLLFACFYLLACLIYLKNNCKFGFDGKSLMLIIFFLLACLSKIQAVSLPLTLLGLDFFVNGKWNWRKWLSKWPLFFISLIFGIGGIVALNEFGSVDQQTFSAVDRLFVGTYSFCVYIFKFIVPIKLAAIYPYPESLSWLHYLSLIPLFAFIVVLVQAYKNDNRKLFLTCWFFLVNIIFVLQILGAGQAYLADRFTYLPYIGLSLAMIYGLEEISVSNKKINPWAAIPVMMIIIFSIISFQQTKVWKNSQTLWSNVIKHFPNAATAHHNLGIWYRETGDKSKAILSLNQAISLDDKNSSFYNSRGKILVNNAQLDEAIQDYSRAIELQPLKALYYNHRGTALAISGDLQKGLEDLNQAIALDPYLPESYLNRSLVYGHLRKFEKALFDNLTYLELRPMNDEIWSEAGMNARMLGDDQSAIEYQQKALSINPNNGMAKEELDYLR